MWMEINAFSTICEELWVAFTSQAHVGLLIRLWIFSNGQHEFRVFYAKWKAQSVVHLLSDKYIHLVIMILITVYVRLDVSLGTKFSDQNDNKTHQNSEGYVNSMHLKDNVKNNSFVTCNKCKEVLLMIIMCSHVMGYVWILYYSQVLLTKKCILLYQVGDLFVSVNLLFSFFSTFQSLLHIYSRDLADLVQRGSTPHFTQTWLSSDATEKNAQGPGCWSVNIQRNSSFVSNCEEYGAHAKLEFLPSEHFM